MTAAKRQEKLAKVVEGVRNHYRECGVILILAHKDGQEVIAKSVGISEGLAAASLLQEHFLVKCRPNIVQGAFTLPKAKKKSGKKGR